MSQEMKRRLKEYQKSYRETKKYLPIAITEIFFISASINSIKDKTVF